MKHNTIYIYSKLIGIPLVAFITACFVYGCSSPNKHSEKCKQHMDQLLIKLQTPGLSEQEFDSCLNAISHSPKYESPQPWITIVNNEKLENSKRRKCLFVMFQRHVHKNIKLKVLSEWHNTDNWFNENTLTAATAGGASLPFKRKIGESVFMFALPFMDQEHSALYLRIKPTTTKKEMLEVLHGKLVDDDIRILEVGFSEPRSERLKRETMKQ